MGIVGTQRMVPFDAMASHPFPPCAFRGKVREGNSKNDIVKIGDAMYFACLHLPLGYLNMA